MARPNPEAIKEAREALHDPQSLGATALHSAVLAYENGWYANFPMPESREAEELFVDLRPPRFAAIAKVVDLTLGVAFERYENNGLDSMGSAAISADKWIEPRSNLKYHLRRSLLSVSDTEPFRYLHRVNDFMGHLSDRFYIAPPLQIRTGIDTATETNLGLLKLFPDLIGYHSPDTPRDQWSEIAKNSSNMSYSLSRRSVESMMAGRQVVVEQPDPDKFKPLFKDGNLVGFTFYNLDGQVVPKGYRPVRHVKPLDSPTTIGEVASITKTVIGCPITLLNGRLRQLWEWMTEIIDESGAWDQKESGTSFAGTAENVNL